MNFEIIGQLLRYKRKAKQWSLKDLEQRTEYTNGFLSQIENGKVRNLKFTTLERILHALDHDLSLLDFLQEADQVERSLKGTEPRKKKQRPSFIPSIQTT